MYPGLSDRRVVVVQAEASPGVLLPWIPVGAVVWHHVVPLLSVVVKLTFSWKGKGGREISAELAEQQLPLSRGQRSSLAGAAESEVSYPFDFVPRKRGADVLVVGHAASQAPTERIVGSVSIGKFKRTFSAAAGGPTTAIPLTTAYLETDDGTPLGPSAPEHPPSHAAEEVYPADFDFGRLHAACGRGHVESLPDDLTLALEGLSPAGPRLVHIPDLVPTVTADTSPHADLPVQLVRDTLWIDVDRERAVLVYRGELALAGSPALPERLVLSIDPAGKTWEPSGSGSRAAALMRGRFGFAVRAQDPEGGHDPATEEEAESLEAARLATWGADAPAPALSLERYAFISAELVEWPRERERILGRHDLDDDRWTIEERAWGERMAHEAMDGDGRLGERYADLFVKYQDAMASPRERVQPLHEYAKIHAAMEVADDTEAALAEHGITLAAYLRMQRRWEAAAREDPALAAELARLVDRFLRELGAADGPSAEGAGAALPIADEGPA